MVSSFLVFVFCGTPGDTQTSLTGQQSVSLASFLASFSWRVAASLATDRREEEDRLMEEQVETLINKNAELKIKLAKIEEMVMNMRKSCLSRNLERIKR